MGSQEEAAAPQPGCPGRCGSGGTAWASGADLAQRGLFFQETVQQQGQGCQSSGAPWGSDLQSPAAGAQPAPAQELGHTAPRETHPSPIGMPKGKKSLEMGFGHTHKDAGLQSEGCSAQVMQCRFSQVFLSIK